MIHANYSSVIMQVKSEIEELMDEEYETFTPTFFLKRNFNYKIKVSMDLICVT